MARQNQVSESLKILIPLYGTYLVFALCIFLIFIPQTKQQLLNQKKEAILQLTDNALSLLRDIDSKIKNGEMASDLARKKAIDHIRDLRYGLEGKDYFWIIDMHGTMIMHPFRPDLEGKDLTRFKDTAGKYPFANMVETVAKNSAGYVNYRWQWKDNTERMAQKTSYVKGFPAWGWIVGTGIYLDDIHGEISIITLKFIQIFVGILIFILLLSVYITHHVLQINKRKNQAEDDLRKSEKRYRFLADNATDAIWILALSDFRFSYLSPSIEQILGYSPEQYKTMTFGSNMTRDSVSLIHSVISEELKQDNRDGMDANRRRNIELQVSKKDGSWIWVEVSARFLRDRNDNPDRVLGITRDISQRKDLEQKLLQTNADLHLAQQLSSIGNWSLDPDADVPFWSDEIYRIFERDSALGAFSAVEHLAIFTGKWKTLFETAIKDARERGIEFNHEGKVILPSGQVKWIHAICKPEWVAPKQRYFLRGTIQDITHRKTMESHIQQTQKMEALGTLAGGIAHDFNNILSAIIGFTELAKLGAAENKRLKDNLDNVLTAGLRARELVKHILAFSRKADVHKDIIQIVPLIKESLKFLRASIPANIDIQTRFMITDATILADQTQIHQVLMNLFNNAAYAMKEKGGVLAVELDNFDMVTDIPPQFNELQPGSYVRLNISDTGVGIEKHVMERIFEPFFTTKVRGEGTGMGLSLSYGIIKAMKGHISVSSEPDMGTTFQILIPKQEKELTPAVKHLPPSKSIKGNGKILLIDDEPAIIGWASKALSKMGYQVVGMTSPLEAIETFKSDPENFDLVITDLTMPRMTGLELSSIITAERPDIPIILCTGFSEELSPDKMKHHGISRVLMKPMVVDELSDAIEETLTSRRLKE